MEHQREDKVVGQIYETRDYDQFEVHFLNREIKRYKVKKLLASFNKQQYLQQPVTVGIEKGCDKLQVADGAHRFTACIEGAFPLYYNVLPDGTDLPQFIAQINANQTPYKYADTLGMYSRAGHPEYVRYKNLVGKYGELIKGEGLGFGKGLVLAKDPMLLFFTPTDAQIHKLMSFKSRPYDTHSGRAFNEGDLVLGDLTKGAETLDYFLDLVRLLPKQESQSKSRIGLDRMQYKHLIKREFIVALHYLLHYRNPNATEQEQFDSNIFLDQVSDNPKLLLEENTGDWSSSGASGDWTPVTQDIEKIYNMNRGSQERLRSYFCEPLV